MQFMTTEELLLSRQQHMQNLLQLAKHEPDWDEVTRRRGHATAQQLIEQVQAIDAELAMAGVKAQGDAA